jgi:hypothetical protein
MVIEVGLSRYEWRSLERLQCVEECVRGLTYEEWRHDRIGVHGASRWSGLERSVMRNQDSSTKIAPRQ